MNILMDGSIVLGRYRIEELVAGAGQCFGYRATDTKAASNKPWERTVFIKQYHDIIPGSEASRGLELLYQALRERLGEKSNYVCLPIESGEAGGAHITVFPFVQGMTLKDKFEAGLSQTECVRISFALIKTVREIHKQGIAHLDLKAGNVVIDENSRDGRIYIRLIDFDGARIDGASLRPTVTGTEFYYSPEHAFPERFGEVSRASDIFTLGVMLSELLFRVHPYEDTTDYAKAIASDDFHIPANQYHVEVVSKVAECLSADPSDRPSAGSLLWTFNRNYESELLASDDASRWQEQRYYVQIAGVGENSNFLRNYYDSIEINRNELRGAKLVGLPPDSCFRLRITRSGGSIVPSQDGIDIRVQGKRVSTDKLVRLPSAGTLKVGENPELLFRVAAY